MSNLEERLSLIASKMTFQEPFIAAVYAKLERKVVKKGTAGTNGVIVEFATEFCDTLTDDELMGLSLHEAMHVVLMHSWRRGNRRPDVFNIACDAFINDTLIKMGYSLPSGGVNSEAHNKSIPWTTTDISAEEIYARLMKDDPPPPEGGGEQGGGDGGQGDGDSTGGKTGGGGWDGRGDLSDAPDQATETDIEAAIVTAAKMSKACGNGGALVDIVLGGGLTPKVSWVETLRHVMTAAARDDYTYARHNKRYTAAGLYMPVLYSEGMGGMVVGVDTSGSMGQSELNQIAAEITAICEDCHPEWVEVIYCDTKVRHTERFQYGEAIELHARGGGGTRFTPVFDYIEDMGERIAVLVYFTDLCGNLDITPPEYPTVWGTTYGYGDKEVPFGEVVEVTV